MKRAAPPTLVVNGRSMRVSARDRRKNLLIFLREDLDLTGAKRGCGIGQCGACTVLADNRPLRACHTIVADVLGRSLTTIEALPRRTARSILFSRRSSITPRSNAAIARRAWS